MSSSEADHQVLFQQVLDIWEEFGPKNPRYVPLVPLPPKPECLLFVGLNPSFRPSVIPGLLGDPSIKPEEYFAWRIRDSFKVAIDVKLHEAAKEGYAYFGRFRKLSTMLGLAWDHIDLFFWRETSQKNAMGLLFVANAPDRLTEFGRRQIELSTKLIINSPPRCVVVANALASRIYEKYVKLEFSPLKGCHIQRIDGREVPVFLSSMLTGQHPLDNYSFQRLAWHIGHELGAKVKFEAEEAG